MSWLTRLLHHDPPPSPEIQAALDIAEAARAATDAARSAVGDYWSARAANERAREEAVTGDYGRAEDRRKR